MSGNFNGPFLLSPQHGRITVAWEACSDEQFYLFYGKDKTKFQAVEVEYKEYIQEPRKDNVKIHYGILENLQWGERYKYEIRAKETICTGEFQYLNKENKNFTIMTISDSHSFDTASEFLRSVERVKPDFIIHSGDISCGTGLQKKEYVDNWFTVIPEVLKSIPVYYIPGNHDSGCIFDEIFMVPQKLYVNNCPKGNSYSFMQGEYHFTIVDSNPWGLYEMNAINSSSEVDNKTQELIQSTIDWLQSELASPRAQAAKWRILVCHHPYTDEYNNKYIAPLVEKFNVNLVLSGHIHYYTKAIAPISETVYISQGCLQVANAGLQEYKGERFLEEFPQVVNIGGNNYGILKLSPEELEYTLKGYEKGNEVLVDIIKLGKNTKKCEIKNLQWRKLDEFGSLEITGTFYNPNEYDTLASIEIMESEKIKHIYEFGPVGKTQEIYLKGKESKPFKAFYNVDKPGKHLLNIGGQELLLDILEREEISFLNFHVTEKVIGANSYILTKMEITNNMDREVFSFIPYYINGKVVETRNIHLSPLEECSLEFLYKVRRRGIYTVTIGNGIQREIEIGGSIRLIPLALDRSGKGNHGLIHGKPRLLKEGKEYYLCLDSDGDYIEVPANENLIARDGFTAQVKAIVQRLAYAEEMGHNPLMVKGKSVGWGATYLFRMVADRGGAVRWGICHDINEIPFIGGKLNIQKLGDYILSFDKKNGGKGYVDDELVAQIPGIEEDEKLRQWENEPIFIGYSYIGHIIPEIDRPKYYTHLKARIKEAKFFTKALSKKQVKTDKKSLALWLDFCNILTWGSYETNWRHPIPNIRSSNDCKLWSFLQLKAKTRIDPLASINLRVQVSDNKIYVKDELEVNLKDGENSIDLTSLQEGKYIKLICHLNGHLGENGTDIAEIMEIEVLGTDGKYSREFFWSTSSDWKQGEFNGAVSIPPMDRLKEFPEYTDIIHG